MIFIMYETKAGIKHSLIIKKGRNFLLNFIRNKKPYNLTGMFKLALIILKSLIGILLKIKITFCLFFLTTRRTSVILRPKNVHILSLAYISEMIQSYSKNSRVFFCMYIKVLSRTIFWLEVFAKSPDKDTLFYNFYLSFYKRKIHIK